MEKKLVIFDFDGVLVRTAEIGYLLHTEANPHLDREYFSRFSLGNFVENMERAIREEGYVVQENWEDLYQEKLLQLQPHDVIRELINDMATQYRLAIVSSTQTYHIEAYLKKEGITDSFAEVLGSDVHFSKVVKINSLLKNLSAKKEETLFITDTLGDVRDGNTCGIHSIGVTWGTHDRETLEKGKPFFIADTVFELRDAVERFFNVSGAEA